MVRFEVSSLGILSARGLVLLAGGNWNNSAHCGWGSRNGNNGRSTLNDNNSARGLIRMKCLTSENISSRLNFKPCPCGKNSEVGVRLVNKLKAVLPKGFKMKRVGNLYEKMISPENWNKAVKEAIKNKKSLFSVKRFLEKGEGYAEELRQQIINGTFKFFGYNTKKIYEPKERILFIARLEERFFHWACMLIVIPIFEPTFHYHSYACRKGKGQHKASLACSQAVRKYDYVIDIDAAKFYPSIPHDRLKKDLARKIKDKKFLEEGPYRIIDSHHTPNREGYGVPIGSYSSQIFGNIYMTKLDNFCNSLEGVKTVLRYCDNSLIFFNDKELARKAKKKIEEFYVNVLDMRMSKSELYPTKQGVDFVGYRHFKDTVLVRKRTAKRIQKRMRQLPSLIENGRIGYKEAMGKVASALGWTKHAHAKGFVRKVGLFKMLEDIKNELKQSA